MQSAIVLNSSFDLLRFKDARAIVIEADKPVRVDEVQAIVPDVDSLDASIRAKAISNLAKHFASYPDPAIDLLADKRSMVRAAAVDAVVLSNNKKLTSVLLFALEDREPFVAERAARHLAEDVNIATLLRKHTEEWYNTPALMKIWPFLNQKTRVNIVTDIFSQAAVPKLKPPSLPVAKIIPPPPIAKPKKSSSAKDKTKEPVGFIAMKEPPAGFVMAKEVDLTGLIPVSNRSMLGITLLRDIPVSDFKLPLKRVLDEKVDEFTHIALQIADQRREKLPVEDLIKLLGSPNINVGMMAAVNPARSAATNDIARIEAEIKKLEANIAASKAANAAKSTGKKNIKEENSLPIIAGTPSNQRLAEELRMTIKKIRLREQLAAVAEGAREPMIKEALADTSINEWVWNEYARDLQEGARPRVSEKVATAINQTAQATIAPFGENIYPASITSFVAFPNLSAALNKLDESLSSIQMHSARGQAGLVLTINTFKEAAKRMLATSDAPSVLDYIGIKTDSPAALATWKPKHAPASAAERKAMVIRVSDRERFERLLSIYQTQLGGFKNLPDNIAIGARLIGLAPAILPLSAAMTSDELSTLTKRREIDSLKESFVHYDECNGYAVKIIGYITIDSAGLITDDPIYLAYVGDTAVLAPDWFSLRDVLTMLKSGGETLAVNPEFKKAVTTGGDVIYMSSLGALFSAMTAKKDSGSENTVLESGAFRISNNSWENLFNLSFKDRDWLKVFLPFQLDSLSSPKELLPASTVAYLMMNVDASAFWREAGSMLFGEEQTKQISEIWAMDFEKEVLPELSSECGFALLALPKVEKGEWHFPWSIFFKLKSEKLITAIREGKLFKNAQISGQTTRLKIGEDEIVATIKNGYLIFAPDEKTMARLDVKEKLDSTRDFARAVKKSPANAVIFGGYSIEAANADLNSRKLDEQTAQFITQFASMSEAFHSQHFYATASDEGISAKLSVSLDREGRYSVGELSALSKQMDFAFAVIESRGAPISDQQKLQSLKLKITTKDAGAIERIKEDVASSHQSVEKRGENELIVTVRPRHPSSSRKAQLPISGAEFSEFLKSTNEIRSAEKSVVDKAREIAQLAGCSCIG